MICCTGSGPYIVVAGSSAEPIREKTVADFCAAFAVCGLRGDALTPIYGSAEHFGVSMKLVGQPARIVQARSCHRKLATSSRKRALRLYVHKDATCNSIP
jgi:hypothetical protein